MRSYLSKASALILCFLLLELPGFQALAADLPYAKDHPLLKRFGGSEIIGYDAKRFDRYELQTSAYKSYNTTLKRREYSKPPLIVEGAVTRIWYEAAGKTSGLELLRNYQNELEAAKFEILYDSTKDSAAGKWQGYLQVFSEDEIRTNRSYYVFSAARKAELFVCSGRLSRAEGDVYVQVTALQWDRDHETYKARQGAYVAVDIIDVQSMTQNMVVVSAGEMAKAIETGGHIALYGIHFDFNKAEIKPESKPALQEIAKLLQNDAGLKLLVVGHTDNVGGLESNLSLSKKRAEAVVTTLTNEYGVARGRLAAHGVAFLAPLTVNTSDQGRAKNRRVELVPQ